MNICIFGASGNNLDAEYFAAAEELGRLLAQGGHSLVFGGGAGGLMGACARGAAEKGGEIVAVTPRFFDEPGVIFPGCTRMIWTETMNERKERMVALSDALITLPGGIGTFEEFFEVLTLKQLGRHAKPLALLSTLDYYAPLLKLLEKAVEGGFLVKSCMELFSLCATPREALDAVLSAPPLSGSVASYHT